MWTYLIGPLVSVLPKRWRDALPFAQAVHWKSASILGGLAESLCALIGLLYWYSYSVTTWVSRALDIALSKPSPVEITDHEVGFAALLIWATHPLTWAIAYVGLEGMVRLCAAFTDTVVGILPLYALEKIYSKVAGQSEPRPAGAPQFAKGHLTSYVDAMKQKLHDVRTEPIPDELYLARDVTDEILEIRSCRAKPEWDPPRIVRYEDRYYRLEGVSRGIPPRPFHYRLRRLSAGVPGRTVLTYSPEESPVIANNSSP